MPEPQLLRVFVNPFCAGLDAEGRVCGAVRYEPTGVDHEFDAALPYIGAHLLATPKKKGSKAKPKAGLKLHHVVKTGKAEDADYDHEFEFHTDVVTVEDTPYYRTLLEQHGQHGPALLPADEATYVLVHGTLDRYRSPHTRLHQYARERAVFPRLVLNDLTIKASKAAHEKRCAVLQKATSEVEFARDPEAEWLAFVGEEIAEARETHEAEQAEAMKRITGESVAPPTH
jgi:hypothetical protein